MERKNIHQRDLERMRKQVSNFRDLLVSRIELATKRTLAELDMAPQSLDVKHTPLHRQKNKQRHAHINFTTKAENGLQEGPYSDQINFNLSETCRALLSMETLGYLSLASDETTNIQDQSECNSGTNVKTMAPSDTSNSNYVTSENTREICIYCQNATLFLGCQSLGLGTEPLNTLGTLNNTDSSESGHHDKTSELQKSLNLKRIENQSTQTDLSKEVLLCNTCGYLLKCHCSQASVKKYNFCILDQKSMTKSDEHNNRESPTLSTRLSTIDRTKWPSSVENSHFSNNFNAIDARGRSTSMNRLNEDQRSPYFIEQSNLMFDLTRRRSLDENSWSSVNSLSITASSVSDNNLSFQHSDSNMYRPLTRKESKILNNVYEDSTHSEVKLYAKFTTSVHRGPCVIPDIELLADQRIVLTDHYHCNIQLYGDDLALQAEVQCQYPMGLTSINDTTIAVNLRRNKEIAVYNVGQDSLTLIRVINVLCDFYIWNVVYKADKLYVVCDENNIHVCDVNGKHFDVIKSNISTEKGYVRYFDVSDDGSCLYLCISTGLHCLTSEGVPLWTFTAEQLPTIHRPKDGYVIEDVCYYNGRLFATQWTRSRIFEISTSGGFIRNVVLEGIENPRAMSVRGRTLVVTQFHPTMRITVNRTVNVFKIDHCRQNIRSND